MYDNYEWCKKLTQPFFYLHQNTDDKKWCLMKYCFLPVKLLHTMFEVTLTIQPEIKANFL